MKFLSIDIETTGLDPERHQILEIGAILEDTRVPYKFADIPKFEAILDYNEILGSPVAISLNDRLFKILDKYHRERDEKLKEVIKIKNNIMSPLEASEALHKWIYENMFMNQETGPYLSPFKKHKPEQKPTAPVVVTAAGKNFATFDRLFLEKMPGFKKVIRINQRIIDPAILYVNWDTDKNLPNLQECKLRGEISGIVTHKAIEDAWDVVQLLRKKY